MNARAALLVVPLAALALAGCEVTVGPATVVQGSGNAKTESRDVHDFDRVDLSGIGTLTITQGTTEALTIRADDNLLPKLESTVQGGTLMLTPVSGTDIRPSTPIAYDLTVKQLKSISVSGAADADTSRLNADQLALDLSGAGHINLSGITSQAVNVTLSGSGVMTVAGQAAQQTVSISGAGKYAASGLSSQRAAVDVSGAGSAEVRVSDHLTATISGAGHVGYFGSPSVDQHVSGAGSVSKSG